MKITVFGGSGFLGSHICDKLSEAGHEVTIVDLNPSPWLKDNQKMIVGSILDEAVLDKAVEGADIVCNYAGIADIGEANSRPVDTARLNVVGNVMALEACRKYGIKRYIFASSLYVYGKSGGFYRCSKQACEIYIENYQYYGAPTALREYVHVDDAATATLEVLDESFANQNIIVTGNQPMRVGDLFKMIGEMLGKDIEIRYQNDPNSGHYQITPYSFMPKVGRKLVPPLTVDLGQGILRVMEAEHRDMHPELTSEGGYLVPTDD